MKRGLALVLLLMIAALCGGCATRAVHPLARAEATPVPGLSMELHAASASADNVDQIPVTLYFRYQDEPMLASERRVLTVRRDESTELAIVRALAEGPSAGHSELTRLLPEGAAAASALSRGELLYVTFSGTLTEDEIPADWAEDPAWREEAPLRRRLALQSVVASLTESFAYTGVQVMLGDARLDRSYFLEGRSGPSEPLTRDESLLLTPINVAGRVLEAWRQRDTQALWRYVADADRPAYEAAAARLDRCAALIQGAASGGSVAEDGQTAVVTLAISGLSQGREWAAAAYPLRLRREYGVWKIAYESLVTLMDREAAQ